MSFSGLCMHMAHRHSCRQTLIHNIKLFFNGNPYLVFLKMKGFEKVDIIPDLKINKCTCVVRSHIVSTTSMFCIPDKSKDKTKHGCAVL